MEPNAQALRKNNRYAGAKAAEFTFDNLVWLLMIGSLLVMGIFQPAFFSGGIIKNILIQSSAQGIMTLGLAHVLMVGEIDLSTVGCMSFSAGLGVYLMNTYGVHWFLTILIIAGFGALVGWLNGIIVTKLKAAALVETLAMNLILTGGLLGLSQGRTFVGFPSAYMYIGKGTVLGDLNIPVMPAPFLLLAVILALVWRYTTFGRSLIATGGNAGCAKASGVAVDRIKIIAFMMSGGLSAFSGYVMSAYMGAVTSSFGSDMQMYALASAVIGGVSLTGGIGKVSGVVGGVLLITIYNVGLQILGISPYFVTAAGGVMILAAVILDALKNRYRQNH